MPPPRQTCPIRFTRFWVFLLLSGALISTTALYAALPGKPGETEEQRNARMAWWRDAHFGMFIHWGLYSEAAGEWQGKPVKGYGEWIQAYVKGTTQNYGKELSAKFNPQKFDATEWVRIAKDAGMKYIVITAKHHDGFAMWHSKADPFNIYDATPFKRDPLKELADACRAAGIKLGFYYSQNLDWANPYARGNKWEFTQDGADFPRYMREKAIPQMTELLTEYGDICEFWFDFPSKPATQEEGDTFRALVWKLQPNAIINNRGGGQGGDFSTPEQSIPGEIANHDWESCMTLNDTWGYKRDDHNWKPSARLIQNLIDCVSKGGNFLLNIGPDAQGIIPPESVTRLAEVGQWLRTNGEAIYGARHSPFGTLPWGRATTKPGKLYLHITDWPADNQLEVPIKNTPTSIHILGAPADAPALTVTPRENSILITLPPPPPPPTLDVGRSMLDVERSAQRAAPPPPPPSSPPTVIRLEFAPPLLLGSTTGNRIFNSDFETATDLKGWHTYGKGWHTTPAPDALAGQRSAQVTFDPNDKQRFKILYQTIVVFPGQTIHATADARLVNAPDLDATLELEFKDATGKQIQMLNASPLRGADNPNATGTLHFDKITAPARTATATLKATVSKNTPTPTAQNARYDNFSLEVTGSAADTPLLVNADFNATKPFDGWRVYGKNWRIDTTPTGKAATAIFPAESTDKFQLISQNIPVKPGQKLTFTALASIAGGDDVEGMLEIEFSTPANKRITLKRSQPLRGINGPTPLALNDLLVPENATIAKLKCTVLRQADLSVEQSVTFTDLKAQLN